MDIIALSNEFVSDLFQESCGRIIFSCKNNSKMLPANRVSTIIMRIRDTDQWDTV